MDMWQLSTGEALWFVEENKTRLVILEDVQGNTVVIDINTSLSEFDEFMPEAQKVVDSVKWGGS
jgi:phosphosulfolactate synthase (CoM biosynthesis protein A)